MNAALAVPVFLYGLSGGKDDQKNIDFVRGISAVSVRQHTQVKFFVTSKCPDPLTKQPWFILEFIMVPSSHMTLFPLP